MARAVVLGGVRYGVRSRRNAVPISVSIDVGTASPACRACAGGAEARGASAQRSSHCGTLCQESVPIDADTSSGTPAARRVQDRPPRDLGDRGTASTVCLCRTSDRGRRGWGCLACTSTLCQRSLAQQRRRLGASTRRVPTRLRHSPHVPEICANRCWKNAAAASPLVPNPRWHSADGALEQSPARTAAVIAVSPKRPAIPVTRVSRGRSAGTGRETRLRRATPWRAAPCSWPPTGRAVAVRCCRPTGRARPADGRTRPIVNVHAPRWGPR
jgi:hypothetical protein